MRLKLSACPLRESAVPLPGAGPLQAGALRLSARRPQLKRDPFDSEVRSTFGFIGRHEDALS